MRPVWLQGSRVTTAVAPRASGAGLGERRGLGVRGAGAAVVALGDLGAVGVEQHAAHPRVRSEGYAGSARQLERATHRALLCRGEAHRPVLTGPRGLRGQDGSRHRVADHLRALLIRTLTVGPGVPPGQPATSRRPGRGLSPPVRSFTAPRARELSLVRTSLPQLAAGPGDLPHGPPHRLVEALRQDRRPGLAVEPLVEVSRSSARSACQPRAGHREPDELRVEMLPCSNRLARSFTNLKKRRRPRSRGSPARSSLPGHRSGRTRTVGRVAVQDRRRDLPVLGRVVRRGRRTGRRVSPPFSRNCHHHSDQLPSPR